MFCKIFRNLRNVLQKLLKNSVQIFRNFYFRHSVIRCVKLIETVRFYIGSPKFLGGCKAVVEIPLRARASQPPRKTPML